VTRAQEIVAYQKLVGIPETCTE